MTNKPYDQDGSEPILLLIQQIREGTVSPKSISKDKRHEIVGLLFVQGQDAPTIAQFLKVCDKTVRRDLAEIREKNALSPDPKFVKIAIGEMFVLSQQHISHLMRLSRSKEGSVGEKVQAEYLAHRVSMERMQRLQSLGYLPTQPQAIIGSFYHNLTGDELAKKFQEISGEVVEVDQVLKDCGIENLEASQGLLEIKKALEKHQELKKDEGKNEQHE